MRSRVGPADVAERLVEHGQDDRQLVELGALHAASATHRDRIDLDLGVAELDVGGRLLLDPVAVHVNPFEDAS